MSDEFKLNYTGQEVNEKLKKIDDISVLFDVESTMDDGDTFFLGPNEWGFGGAGNFSNYIEVEPSTMYTLSFPVAKYDGTGQAYIILHEYDSQKNEIDISDNDKEVNVGNEKRNALGFMRVGAETFGHAAQINITLFPNGGYRAFNTAENCKYIRLEFLPYTNSPERLPEITMIGEEVSGDVDEKNVYSFKENSVDIKSLKKRVVSKNLFDKETATTRKNVFLGKDSNGIEMYGWFLAGNGSAATAQSGSGIDSTSQAIEVEGGETYYKPTGTTLNCFDENDILIAVSPFFSVEAGAYTLPSNAKYVRIGFRAASREMLQFIKGTKPAPYESFKYGLPKLATEQYSKLNEVLYRNALNAEYLPDYMKDIVSEARKYVASNRHTFLLISDTHTTPVTEYVGSLAANMTKYIPCSYIAHGGDIIDGLTDKASELEILSSLCRNFNDSQCPVLYAKGNHDYNALYAKNNGGLAEDYILNDELYCHTNRFYKKHINGNPRDMYFYIDDEETKIRTIFMDNNHHDETETDGLRPNLNNTTSIKWGAEQMQWFADALDFSEKGTEKSTWGVITVSHRMAGSCIKQIIQNFRKGISETFNVEFEITTNFAEQGAMEFIACFVGDDHYDALEVKTDSAGTYPVIKILNASLARDNVGVPTANNGVLMPPVKTFNTEDETAFDIVTVDRESKRIYLTRYGAVSYVYNSDTQAFDIPAARTRIINYTIAEYERLTD